MNKFSLGILFAQDGILFIARIRRYRRALLSCVYMVQN